MTNKGNKRLSILLVGCLLSVPVTGFAQAYVWKKLVERYKRAQISAPAVFERSRLLKPKQLDKILRGRVSASQQKMARTPGATGTQGFWDHTELTAVDVRKWPPELTALFAKRCPVLQNAQVPAVKNYFIAFHNRLAATHIKQRKKIQEDIQTHLPRLVDEQIVFTQEAFSQQAARLVPAQVNQILIGEEHQSPQVAQHILSFLKEIAARNPNRRVIYFAEFLDQGEDLSAILPVMRFTGKDPEHYMIYDWLQQHRVPVVGLEMPAVGVTDNTLVVLKDEAGRKVTQDIWKSLSGLYLRNQAWLRVIRQYRQKYPDALFIIHAGAWHTGYIMPFSLAQSFAPQETFVALFMKEDYTLLNLFSRGRLSAPRLGWKDKNLARVAGFDVQLLTHVKEGN